MGLYVAKIGNVLSTSSHSFKKGMDWLDGKVRQVVLRERLRPFVTCEPVSKIDSQAMFSRKTEAVQRGPTSAFTCPSALRPDVHLDCFAPIDFQQLTSAIIFSRSTTYL